MKTRTNHGAVIDLPEKEKDRVSPHDQPISELELGSNAEICKEVSRSAN